MEIEKSKITIELLAHGKRKRIPKILDCITVSGFLGAFILMILQKNNIPFSNLIAVLVAILLIFGIIAFMISIYRALNCNIDALYHITGKIRLTENSIEINENCIDLQKVKKIHLRAVRTRGYNRSSEGANNKIEIKTTTGIITQRFVIEDREKREDLKNYVFYLKTKNIETYVDGIDLK
ncbi:hypothetical protein [Flavobacterium cerinum]|uniref:DUF304 domain-containing protein n=1 Tax=Flavobacterium cerinum TaxID=2502784 RepID=A0ABY5IPH1_9FLAO|nr:hypothetical protein [Flavobacterium cerinum]UUC44727.1 hypothetical protein NOX80_13940 [Flavobacterium cerinum]